MAISTEEPIELFLDHQATTPVNDEVLDAMLPYFEGEFGNASARNSFGRSAAFAVESAREQVAAMVGAGSSGEIVFTSGATESNAIVLRNLFPSPSDPGHLVTTAIEHPSIGDRARDLAAHGHDVTILPVDRDGSVDPQSVRASLRPQTRLVSVMHANNEVGTVQRLVEIGTICRESSVLFHSDMTQTAGNMPVDVTPAHVDLASVSAHKFYGPKGVGALFVRETCGFRSGHGATSESGLRPGTLNVPGIVGMGRACEVAQRAMPTCVPRISVMRDQLLAELEGRLLGVTLNGHPTSRTPGNLSVTIAGVEADELLRGDPALGISLGSACTSGRPDPSHVLLALGMTRSDSRATIRVGLGRGTTWAECEQLVERLMPLVHSSRQRNGYATLRHR